MVWCGKCYKRLTACWLAMGNKYKLQIAIAQEELLEDDENIDILSMNWTSMNGGWMESDGCEDEKLKPKGFALSHSLWI